jgi:hypothetical protein
MLIWLMEEEEEEKKIEHRHRKEKTKSGTKAFLRSITCDASSLSKGCTLPVLRHSKWHSETTKDLVRQQIRR